MGIISSPSLLGINGHACLLRAVCEVGSTPAHQDGLMGDAVTMLLTASSTINAVEEGTKEYAEAQARGQVSASCCGSTYR